MYVSKYHVQSDSVNCSGKRKSRKGKFEIKKKLKHKKSFEFLFLEVNCFFIFLQLNKEKYIVINIFFSFFISSKRSISYSYRIISHEINWIINYIISKSHFESIFPSILLFIFYYVVCLIYNFFLFFYIFPRLFLSMHTK